MKFQKGHKTWNKGTKGLVKPNSGSFKKGIVTWSKLHPELMPKGKNHWHWKGGRIKNTAGYILIHKPKHPFCTKQGYVREHRLVTEKFIGRYLLPTEKVHHLNGVRNDNRPKNLYIFQSKFFHKIFHLLVSKNVIDLSSIKKSNLITYR